MNTQENQGYKNMNLVNFLSVTLLNYTFLKQYFVKLSVNCDVLSLSQHTVEYKNLQLLSLLNLVLMGRQRYFHKIMLYLRAKDISITEDVTKEQLMDREVTYLKGRQDKS